MLAASPLKSEKNEREREMQGLSMEEEKREFGDDNLLDAIDFDDLLPGGVLPDLEMDHPFFAEFSASESETKLEGDNNSPNIQENGANSISDPTQEPESEPVVKKEGDACKKSPVHSKNQPGKKKAKVDWTPELHRRFVQAVEELGIDKAVPSRILEIMGINCLTRHNIASHLQKYRSHRKHVQAREAETASWNRRRQIYGAAAAQAEVNPWIAPTLGFPPASPMPHFRPLHVWGHPSADQLHMYTWPKHLAPPPPPPHNWPAPPLVDPSFWHPNHQYVPPPGTLFFPPPHIQPTRFPRPAATAIPAVVQKLPLPPSDVHPSKETLDEAIGDVLSKPWLPLPLGLKPPSMDAVMVELRRQGVSKVPPT